LRNPDSSNPTDSRSKNCFFNQDTIKVFIIAVGFLFLAGSCVAADEHGHHKHGMSDQRISLGFSAEMKQHQLTIDPAR
jgi:hypothetical protein